MISASEVARQLRLRDMGGIVVVDFIDLGSSDNRRILFEHLKSEMSTDRTKHKILPPSKFGLIQITRQRVRPEMNIKTKEPNPNLNGEVEAPIVLLDKINADLNKIVNNAKHQNKKIELHIHPFIAAYLNRGFPSIRTQWLFKHKKRVKIIPRDAYQYLHYRFFDNTQKPIRVQ
ncbi:MAG: ribonuclease E/G, partial [Flavobacteriaceae bacterium]|nr:ribonuclease E/G [Flavobacteriaceae bacterium]